MRIILISGFLLLSACSKQGPTGPQGVQGSQGPLGLSAGCTVLPVTSPVPGSLINCSDGSSSLVASGTIVTPVQLCPNVTTYPKTFSEVAFCINSQLYAVYSTHDGFLTVIPPGQYSSDGINSSCTFTVTSNCGVLHD